MTMSPEKLAKLQANQKRSKGAPRRVIKKVHRAVAQDDRKLQGALEKLALAPQPYVEDQHVLGRGYRPPFPPAKG